jgi:hypothetical protein
MFGVLKENEAGPSVACVASGVKVIVTSERVHRCRLRTWRELFENTGRSSRPQRFSKDGF